MWRWDEIFLFFFLELKLSEVSRVISFYIVCLSTRECMYEGDENTIAIILFESMKSSCIFVRSSKSRV